jgi:hypothetical protein
MSKLKTLLKKYDEALEASHKTLEALEPLQTLYKAQNVAITDIEDEIDKYMVKMDLDIVEEAGYKVSYRKSNKTVVTDETKLPESVFEIKKTISLTKVKKALESGELKQGAEIQENKNLQIKKLND